MPLLINGTNQHKVRFRKTLRSSSRRSSSGDLRPHADQDSASAVDGHQALSIMARSGLPAKNTAEQPTADNSAPPEMGPLVPVPALDLREYGVELCSDLDMATQDHARTPSPGIRPTNTDELPSTPPEQPQSILVDVPGSSMPNDRLRLLSRPTHVTSASRTSGLTPPPQSRAPTRNPSSAPTTPYLSAFRSSTDNLAPPSQATPQPTSPTHEALSELGPPPGQGPSSARKVKQRITIWAQEMAEVNEKQPTKPLPKPPREWERLGRRLLKRRGQEEWPGPMQDGERVDPTGMYGGQRRTLSDGEYWGPHPSLNKGDGTSVDREMSPFPPSPLPTEKADPSREFPLTNILIDNKDGAADSPDELKLSQATTPENEDPAKKAKIATDERLDRAAKLLANQQPNQTRKDNQKKNEEQVNMSEKKPVAEKPNLKPYINIMPWRKSQDQKKP